MVDVNKITEEILSPLKDEGGEIRRLYYLFRIELLHNSAVLQWQLSR